MPKSRPGFRAFLSSDIPAELRVFLGVWCKFAGHALSDSWVTRNGNLGFRADTNWCQNLSGVSRLRDVSRLRGVGRLLRGLKLAPAPNSLLKLRYPATLLLFPTGQVLYSRP